MTIQLKNTLNNVSSFTELGAIVRNAKEDISFFGGRYIYADGYKGAVDIDAIAICFNNLKKRHFEPSEEDRLIGRETVPLITKLYESNYSRNRNLFTRVFRAVRDFFRCLYNFFIIKGYGTRDLWFIDVNTTGGLTFFNTYTSRQYQERFNEPPPTVQTGYFLPCDSSPGCPDRYYPPGYFQ